MARKSAGRQPANAGPARRPPKPGGVSDETLPSFLTGLADANFYLLTPLSASPVRLAAIDFAQENWRAGARFEAVYRTRVLDLNLDDVESSDDAERILIDGTNVDTIAYRRGSVVIAKNEGSTESDIEVVLHLSVDDPGSFCDCDLPDMGLFTSEKIDIAIDDLDSGDALQWHTIEGSR